MGQDDETAVPEFAEAYDALKAIAERHMRGQQAHTLQTTALVNEAWMRLGQRQSSFVNREHFMATAARAMRHVLVDHARAKHAAKRGGDVHRVSLLSSDNATEAAFDVLDLDDALTLMAEEHERGARVVELKFFGGLTIPEIAEALDVSHMTVSNDWKRARVWLSRKLA